MLTNDRPCSTQMPHQSHCVLHTAYCSRPAPPQRPSAPGLCAVTICACIKATAKCACKHHTAGTCRLSAERS